MEPTEFSVIVLSNKVSQSVSKQAFSTKKRKLLTPASCNQGHTCETKQA